MKAMTLRLDPQLQDSLDKFSKIVGKPKNRLVNEAVRMFLELFIRQAERDARETLDKLRDLKLRHPGHEQAIRDFAAAEVDHADVDPFEFPRMPAKGPVTTEIRELLHG